MKLYFSPLACSMATRIALYEAGIAAEYQHVDHATRVAPDGTDVRRVHPLGYVPVLLTDDGELLTENAAILSHVASRAAVRALAPRDDAGRMRLVEALSFIGTELHKAVFFPLLDRNAPPGARDYALAAAERRLPALAGKLEGRAFVLDAFSVADAYLFTVLNWAQVTPVRLARWPAVATYMARLRERPAVARAVAEETELYVNERGRPQPPPASTKEVVDRFNEAFQRHDGAAFDELVAEGCVTTNVDGSRHAGKHACVELWRGLAADAANEFTVEDVLVAGDDAIIRWRLARGASSHAGVNVMRVRAGRIVEARGYVQAA